MKDPNILWITKKFSAIRGLGSLVNRIDDCYGDPTNLDAYARYDGYFGTPGASIKYYLMERDIDWIVI